MAIHCHALTTLQKKKKKNVIQANGINTAAMIVFSVGLRHVIHHAGNKRSVPDASLAGRITLEEIREISSSNCWSLTCNLPLDQCDERFCLQKTTQDEQRERERQTDHLFNQSYITSVVTLVTLRQLLCLMQRMKKTLIRNIRLFILLEP